MRSFSLSPRSAVICTRAKRIDEIQESPKAIQLLRYFYEEIPGLYVIAAGSLLEFSIKEVESFPVGSVAFLYLYPFNFQEYIEAIPCTHEKCQPLISL